MKCILALSCALLLAACASERSNTQSSVAPPVVSDRAGPPAPSPFSAPPADPFGLPVEPLPGLMEVVDFGVGRHNVDATQVGKLNALAEYLTAHREWVRITGYASPEGPAAVNQRLGLQRAQAVRDYLVREGVEDWKIEAVQSAAGTPNAVASRRVEVWLETR